MTINEIARYTGLDPADVRRKVHSMRCKGYGVIGGNDGLSVTTDLDLKVKQAEKMLGNAKKMQEAAEGMFKEVQELDELEQYILSLLPEKKGLAPEVWRTTFEEIEVRDGKVVEI